MTRLQFAGLAAMALVGLAFTASADAQPEARKHHSLVYDAGRRQIVMYGGASNANQILDDFWSYDGRQWTLVGRSIASSAHHLFSDADGVLWLVGGRAAMTATWDGSAWVP